MSHERALTFATLLRHARSKGCPVILDGAVGTELDNRSGGLDPDLWTGLASLNCPDLLIKIHREYVQSGAQIITTSTFRTTAVAFEKAGQRQGLWRKAARAAVALAREAAGSEALVAGCIAPLEDCFLPNIAPKGPTAVKMHGLLCDELVRAGVDVLWLETFGTLGELESAISAAKESAKGKNIPFVVGVTTAATGTLISGESLLDAYRLARRKGAAAFNINCVPPGHVVTALGIFLAEADIPVGVYANLGFAEKTQDWEGSAHMVPEAYVALARQWIESGVGLIGGCCGSTPQHIQALSQHVGL